MTFDLGSVLTSWPFWTAAVAVFFLVMFRATIRSVIDRVTGIGRTGITVGGASKEAQALPSAAPSVPAGGTGLDELVAELDNPHLRAVMATFSEELERRGVNRDPARSIPHLTKMLASLAVLADFESIEGIIFGSQIDILTFLNTVAGGDRARLLPAYERALAQFPDTFANYGFDDYAAFLVNRGLVVRNGNTFVLTDKGRAFLMWRIHNRKPGRPA